MKREKSCGALVYRVTPNGQKELLFIKHRHGTHWSFPKGHMEEGETEVQTALREVKEETGLDIKKPVLCGIKQWYTEEAGRYIVLFFKTNQFSGKVQSSDEGEIYWVPKEKLLQCKLARDMDEMYRIFESDGLTEMYYYKNEEGGWEHTLL